MSKLERGGGGLPNSCFKIVVIGLLVVLGVLAFNYWSVINAHRVTNDKLTKLGASYDELKSIKIDESKRLDVCSEQLKAAETENKQLKESISMKEKNLSDMQNELKQVKEDLSKALEEKSAAEKKLDEEKQSCTESLANREESCRKSCNDEIQSAKTAAATSCQQQIDQLKQQQQQRVLSDAQLASQQLQQQNNANDARFAPAQNEQGR